MVVENDLKEKPNHITIISFSYTNTLPPPRKRTSFYWKETRLVHNRTCPWVLLLLDLLRVEEAGLLETSEVDTYGQHLPTTQKKTHRSANFSSQTFSESNQNSTATHPAHLCHLRTVDMTLPTSAVSGATRPTIGITVTVRTQDRATAISIHLTHVSTLNRHRRARKGAVGGYWPTHHLHRWSEAWVMARRSIGAIVR